jgi:hypothetical protein
MSKINYYKLDNNSNSNKKNIHNLVNVYGIEFGKKFLDYNTKKLLDNSFKLGKKLFSNLPLKNTNNEICPIIRKDIYRKIEDIDVENNLDKVKKFVEEFEKKYNFPKMTDREYITFSKQLMMFYLMYTYNRDYIIIYNHQLNNYKCNEDSKQYYEEYILEPRIEKFNAVRKDLFNDKTIDYDIFKDKAQNKTEKEYLQPFKKDLLNAVNEFSISINYSVTSFVDPDKQTIHITSSNIFFLIWHIFVNYVLANVLPEKISFCDYCLCMIENKTKLAHRCRKHKDRKITNKTTVTF